MLFYSKKYLPTLGLMVCIGCTSNLAQAQTTFSIGPQIGLNASTVHYADGPMLFNMFPPSYRTGFEAGLLGSLEFKHLTLQASVLYSQKGYKVKDAAVLTANIPGLYNGNYLLNYLTLPVNVDYTTRANGQGLRVFAGPYLGILVNGSYNGVYNINGLPPIEIDGKIVGGDNPEAAVNTTNIYSKRMDFGLQGGLGYRYQSLLL